MGEKQYDGRDMTTGVLKHFNLDMVDEIVRILLTSTIQFMAIEHPC